MFLSGQTHDQSGHERPKLVEVAGSFALSVLQRQGKLTPCLWLDMGGEEVMLPVVDLPQSFGKDADKISDGVFKLVYRERPRQIVTAYEARALIRREGQGLAFKLTMEVEPTRNGQVIIHYENPQTVRVWAAPILRCGQGLSVGGFIEIPHTPGQDQGRFVRYYDRAATQALWN